MNGEPVISAGRTRIGIEGANLLVGNARRRPDLALAVVAALTLALDFRPEVGVSLDADPLTDPRLHPWVPGAACGKGLMQALQDLREAKV